jgi:hypothetical protein
MHRLMLAGAAILVLAPSLEAADKTRTCRALTEDGTSTIVEQTYELGKFDECLTAVKAKVAETKCAAGLKRFKFMMQREDNKPYASFVDCGGAAAAEPAAAAATADAPALGTGDRKCKAMSEDGSKVLVTASYKLGDYDQCLKLVKDHLAKTQCSGATKRFKYQMQRESEKPYPSTITCP